jgi:hypothetical protein
MGVLVRHRLVNALHLLLAAPPIVVTVALTALAGAELSGSHPLTMGAPRSVAEAIALRDEATAARLLEDGAGINEIGLIRPGIIGSQPVLATPLEAAVLVDAPAAFEYLRSRGAALDPSLACLASDIGARAVRAQMTDASSCRTGAALQVVLDRP